jgi:hypothetical protein
MLTAPITIDYKNTSMVIIVEHLELARNQIDHFNLISQVDHPSIVLRGKVVSMIIKEDEDNFEEIPTKLKKKVKKKPEGLIQDWELK